MAEVVNEIEETIDVSMSDAQFALLRGKYIPSNYSARGWRHDDAAMLPREAAVM